jgi:hypothetical protein
MNPLPDSWFALIEYDREIIVFLSCMLWGSIVTISVLRTAGGVRLGLSESISLALGGWVLPVLPASILIIGLGILFKVHPDPLVLGTLMIGSMGVAVWSLSKEKSAPARKSFLVPLFLLLFFLVSILLRLAFIAHILLPPYFDSAEHYRIIQSLVGTVDGTRTAHGFTWPVASYYHIGYHAIAAVLTAAFHLDIKNVMLVSGQIALAAVPIPLFLIVRRVTQSNLAASFTVLLAACGWYMPAYSINWGKYPALFSLLPVEFTLGAAYLAGESGGKAERLRILSGMVLLGISVSFLIHTRSLIILGMIFAAWILASYWERQSIACRYLFLGGVLMVLIVEFILVMHNAILDPVLGPYINGGILATGLVSLFSAAAFQKYPRFAFSTLLVVGFLLSGLFLPVPFYAYTTLLDRPLVEMLLFMPLAVLGGAGCAGLIDLLQNRPSYIKKGAFVLLSGVIVVHAFTSFSFYPSDCCSFVTRDDLVALDWMGKNLPGNVRILIPSSNLSFSISPAPFQEIASDAGVWILPLAGRQTLSLLYSTDFAQPGVLETICQQGVTHIYVGGAGQGFDAGTLVKKPEWYTMVLFLPQAKVYRVTGCAN